MTDQDERPTPEQLGFAGCLDELDDIVRGLETDTVDVDHLSQTVSRAADLVEWCRERRIDFLPVVYPGFSWHNLHGGPLDDIPRLKGQFLWSQVAAAKRAGAQMLYVAMFDEVDEGTAIFKCTNQPPTANGAQFLTYEGLPPDFYLHLTGQAGRLIRDEIPLSDSLPTP